MRTFLRFILLAFIVGCVDGYMRTPYASLLRQRIFKRQNSLHSIHGSIALHAKRLDNVVENVREVLITPPDMILDAVDKANRRLTVSDAAALSGADFTTCRNGLMALSTLTGRVGHIPFGT
jgi:hypothetical protein